MLRIAICTINRIFTCTPCLQRCAKHTKKFFAFGYSTIEKAVCIGYNSNCQKGKEMNDMNNTS